MNVYIELAQLWEHKADTSKQPIQSETLRECADTLRMLEQLRREFPTSPAGLAQIAFRKHT